MKFATAVRERVNIRKRWSRLRTYDDLQGRLHEIITDEEGAGGVRADPRPFRGGPVDEFQDTDPQQWEIPAPVLPRPPADGPGR